jgi:hypothetical protein
MIVDAVFVVVFGIIWLGFRGWTFTVAHVVIVDAVLVLALAAYRIAQEYKPA